jgi:hypothetical protein
MTKGEVEFVSNQTELDVKKKKDEEYVEESLSKLLEFLNEDIKQTIIYINYNNIPIDYNVPGKKMDIHPSREYLLKIPKTITDVIKVKEMMKEDGNDLDDFFNDENK